MFSKKPQLAHQTPAPAPVQDAALKRLVLGPLTNPVVGVGLAALLLAASLTALVLTGDPNAGAPSVRVALSAHAGEAGGFHDAFGAEAPYGEFDGEAIDMMPMEELGGETPYGGEVVITDENGQQRRVPVGRATTALPKAPLAGLFQQGPSGVLPVIAQDGRTPAQAYARPFASNGKPKVAVIITGLGIVPEDTRQAIEMLPPEVTLSFAVRDTVDLQSWIDLARSYGHEVMLDIPMEPRSFPQDDPGPGSLMANLPADENLKRLDAFLAKATGYFGVSNYMGSKFLTSGQGSDAFATGLRRRGLAFVDDGIGAQRVGGVPRATADKVIDDSPGADSIARGLAQVEQSAKNRGQALASGFAYRLTIAQVAAWSRSLEAKGLQLAPVSALTARR